MYMCPLPHTSFAIKWDPLSEKTWCRIICKSLEAEALQAGKSNP